jgi:GPI-anchor transamidase subunit S
MLALLYFPAEHTAAVYAPLFVPALLPLLVILVREFREWKGARHGGAEGAMRSGR